ncbi:hypothetical protein BH11ACT6_BH11ACT6_24480 [soil metagenome]
MILLLVGALVLIIGPRVMKRGPRAGAPGVSGRPGRPGQAFAEGTLLVTGVSPRPDGVDGEQFVTISGVINGPTVNEHVVYQRMAIDVNQWPAMGQLFPVVYSPKNPDKWNFAPQEMPPPPQQPPYAPPA